MLHQDAPKLSVLLGQSHICRQQEGDRRQPRSRAVRAAEREVQPQAADKGLSYQEPHKQKGSDCSQLLRYLALSISVFCASNKILQVDHLNVG